MKTREERDNSDPVEPAGKASTAPVGRSPTVSIVVPVYRDHAALASLLPRLREGTANEVLVVGVCDDQEAEAVARAADERWLAAPAPGRAAQMNLGAAGAQGDVLLFLHADTQVMCDVAAGVRRSIAGGAVGGAFARRFDAPSRFLRLTCRLADWRGRRWGWFLGDQGIFARTEVFRALGGFPLWDRFEDLEFSRRLARQGPTQLLQPPLVSSARRFAEGAIRRTLKDLGLTARYLASSRNMPTAGNRQRGRALPPI
ncbi:MAG: glycosyltransferase [Opitutales bacterium]